MPVVAVTGDAATTTAVALTAVWPPDDAALLVEADPSGGDLAAWFDIPPDPSLSTVAARASHFSESDLDAVIRSTPHGIRLVVAPTRTIEARRAVTGSAATVVPLIEMPGGPLCVVDVGRRATGPFAPVTNPYAAAASVVIVVHHQSTQSAGAAAVRLRRLAESLLDADHPRHPTRRDRPATVVAVIGDRPYETAEIERFLLAEGAAEPGSVVELAADPLAAAVLAGRRGVSERRLRRLPLMRTVRELARVVRTVTDHPTSVIR